MRRLITSESVTEGHPDKIADQISDSVLDAIYQQDPQGRVACETLITTGLIVVAGEITTSATIDVASIARETVRDVGYDNADYGFDCDTCGVVVSLDKQSPDIAMGVNDSEEHAQGAGDQGMMYGYASNESAEFMPYPILMAHRLTKQLASCRKEKVLPWLRSDGKSQVSVVYEDGKPVALDTIVVSTQHSDSVTQEEIRKQVIEKVVKPVLPNDLDTSDVTYHINPTGRFVIGGPMGDCGLTGRKIIVDTYGGVGRHGGGAFSGKDPSKVDRSAAYAARHVAKNVVAAGLADRAEVALSYAIGVADPTSVAVNTFGTAKVDEVKLGEVVLEKIDLTPSGIIRRLNLRQPIYRQTAAYGHFGREGLPWEALDLVDTLKSSF